MAILGGLVEAGAKGIDTLFRGGTESFGDAALKRLRALDAPGIEDGFNLRQLHKNNPAKFEEIGERARQAFDHGNTEEAAIFNVELEDLQIKSNDAHAANRNIAAATEDLPSGEEQLARLEPGYVSKYMSDTGDMEALTARLEANKAVYEEQLAVKEGKKTEAYIRRSDRKIDEGNLKPGVSVDPEERLKRGVKGTYDNPDIREVTSDFIESRQEMEGRLGEPLYQKEATVTEFESGQMPPGKKLPKPQQREVKANEGIYGLIEQHHMMSNYDSAALADQLNRLGTVLKHNAYVYMLEKFKMLPGDFDLNIANIPRGPHREVSQGNLHAWLKDMGFEEYWRAFNKANPGNTDPNKIMEAINIYFDEVFYPALIKMDALVQNAPEKHKWDGLYIAPYLLKDAKARVAQLNELYSPAARFPVDCTAYDTAVDAKHTLASQQGSDTQTRAWETVDGLPIMSREGFGGSGVGDLTKPKAQKALKKKSKTKR